MLKTPIILYLGATDFTLIDAWRMMWEYDIKLVIMLTQCKENDKVGLKVHAIV